MLRRFWQTRITLNFIVVFYRTFKNKTVRDDFNKIKRKKPRGSQLHEAKIQNCFADSITAGNRFFSRCRQLLFFNKQTNNLYQLRSKLDVRKTKEHL